jgi:hypothetical protein
MESLVDRKQEPDKESEAKTIEIRGSDAQTVADGSKKGNSTMGWCKGKQESNKECEFETRRGWGTEQWTTTSMSRMGINLIELIGGKRRIA